MLDADALRRLGIEPWDEVREGFAGSDILLGNGFSINISDQFVYDSLFEEFLESIGPIGQGIFRRFATTNFEAILTDLLSAARVNPVFGLPTERIRRAERVLRLGLIRAIERVHPRAQQIDRARLEVIARSFDGFGDIFTTNYDALIYHIIMLRKDRYEWRQEGHPYNDYFWDVASESALRFRNFQNYPQYKHVYYLHGALFLFKDGAEDFKIRRGADAELLDVVRNRLEAGSRPLFISEGTADAKETAISESEYLRFASSKLAARRDRMVIYGFSFQNQDRHVINALSAVRRLAVSIYPGSRNEPAISADVHRVRALFGNSDVVFFDATTLFA